jgi:cyclin-dependent kinase regulatory subunit CKS1
MDPPAWEVAAWEQAVAWQEQEEGAWQDGPLVNNWRFVYSRKYHDAIYEYRHVILPTDVARLCPQNKLLSESEWRQLGVQQSRGWEHYAVHKPEPHVLLFRRPVGNDPVTGVVPENWIRPISAGGPT